MKLVRVTDLPRGNERRVPPLGIGEIESALRKAAAGSASLGKGSEAR